LTLAAACAHPVPLPTYQVTRRDFTHSIAAEGQLVDGDASAVIVPGQVRHGGRILWMIEDGSEVEAGQVVMRLDHYELEQQLERELVTLESADVERGRAAAQGRSSVDDAITRKDLAGLELDHAERFRRDDGSVFSKSEILDSHIDEELARARRDNAQQLEGIQSDRAQAQVEKVDVERRLADLEVELAQAALRALELRAPRSGTLLWSRDWRGETARIGEQVFNGQVMAEITDQAGLEAQVYVLDGDADGLAVGRRAEIAVDAHPGRTYSARVARIDPIARRRFRGSPAQYVAVTLTLDQRDARIDPIARRRFRGSPAQYVAVTLTLDQIEPTVMKTGLRVTASIVLDQVADGLVVPRLALFDDDSGYRVYVADGARFEPRPVTVRRLTPGLVLLDGGVDAGEVVALELPAMEAAGAHAPAIGG
jgi:multidrug efflux pump subunit AcrA (membrane-fusion protein)